MDALRSYLSTAMLASVASAICIQITDERFRKYVKYIAGLCILLVLTMPLLSLVSEIEDITLNTDQKEPSLSEESDYLTLLGSQLAESIGDRVALLYELPREAIYVAITLDSADLSAIEIISIDLTLTVDCDEQAMAEALAQSFACQVNIREEIICETTD